MTLENLKNAQEIMTDIKNIIKTLISQQILFNVLMFDFHCDPSKNVETIFNRIGKFYMKVEKRSMLLFPHKARVTVPHIILI